LLIKVFDGRRGTVLIEPVLSLLEFSLDVLLVGSLELASESFRIGELSFHRVNDCEQKGKSEREDGKKGERKLTVLESVTGLNLLLDQIVLLGELLSVGNHSVDLFL